MATRSAARCCSRSARRARAPLTAASTASLRSRWRSGRPSSRSMSACSSASAGRRFALWWHKGGLCLAGAVLSIPLQGLDAMALPLTQAWHPQAWTTGLGTAFGLTAIIAAAALALGLVALRGSSRSRVKFVALTALAGAGVALAASGHAGTAQPSFVTRPSVFLHAIAVAFWIGSLLPLLVLLRTAPDGDAALKRFSRTIPFALVALAASGVLLAVVQLDRLDALWTTNYGLVLSGKLALILALLALAAANRYRLVPRFERLGRPAARPLAASIAVECVI